MSRSSSIHLPPRSDLQRADRTLSSAGDPDLGEIREGLRRREFQAYVQPKVDLNSNAVHSVEVLARWNHLRRGLLTPSAFIPLMTRENLLDDLLIDMLDQGLACQVELAGKGQDLGFAFNLSLPQLANGELLSRLITRLRQHPLPLSSVTFEITEDGPAVTNDATTQAVNRLRQLGISLSLDDYGTGQSSLLRLCDLPFDEIKLAGEFTRHLPSCQQYLGAARATVMLARELNLRLVVEGIETDEQRRCLVQLGVQVGQGYLFAMPMQAECLSHWLGAHALNVMA